MLRAKAREYVSRCASLAALLEVSAYPKPGNVHRTRNFLDTKYEHFLAGSVALGGAMGKLAVKGHEAESGERSLEDLGLGEGILEAVTDSLCWQNGGNVNLGVVLLFAPLATAAGSVLMRHGEVIVQDLREKLELVTRSTTPEDAVRVYEAIRASMTPKILGEVEELDVHDESASYEIVERGMTLIDVFRLCSDRDLICREWTSGFKVTFEEGYPHLGGALDSGDVNSAIVDAFLLILSKNPDSLIIRKSGETKAAEVSARARGILELGGSGSEAGKDALGLLDEELAQAGRSLNPGTTADLTASSLFVALLEGWRP
jgi:triphosphoribosyl-dephospho-CoA synthase